MIETINIHFIKWILQTMISNVKSPQNIDWLLLYSVNEYWSEKYFHRINNTWALIVRKCPSCFCNIHHWLATIELIVVFYKCSSIIRSFGNGNELKLTLLSHLQCIPRIVRTRRVLLYVLMVCYQLIYSIIWELLLYNHTIISVAVKQHWGIWENGLHEQSMIWPQQSKAIQNRLNSCVYTFVYTAHINSEISWLQ